MNAAFIVTLDVESIDPDHLAEVASYIEEDLMDGGQVVVSVAPWARHTETPTPTLSSISSVLPDPVRPDLTPIRPLE